MKKFFSLVLSFLMTTMFPFLAYATEIPLSSANTSNVQNISLVKEKIEAALNFILLEKECYGLAEADISSFSIGDAIPVYEVISGKLYKSNAFYYPVYDADDQLVLTASIIVSDSISVSLSNDFVAILDRLPHNATVGLIYDDNSAYITTGNGEVFKIADFDATLGRNRDDISGLNHATLVSVKTTSLGSNHSLDVMSTSSVQPRGSDDDAIYLDVPIITQPANSAVCWAACMASIVNYRSGTNLEISDITGLAGWYTHMTLSETTALMNATYNTGYYYSLTTTNCYSDIWQSLNLYDSTPGCFNPVLARFGTTNYDGHGVVIRAMNAYGFFSVMDPESSTYRTGSYVLENGSYSFRIQRVGETTYSSLTHYAYKALTR